MVIIDRLVGKHGNARALIGMTDDDSLFDMSDDAWGNRYEVLQGLQFRHVRLAETDVKVNFVGCVFEASEFQRLQSRAHFWAANNLWQECLFDLVSLEETISPMNSFQGCRFTGSTIINYKVYQTLFDRCSFDRCDIAGLRAQLVFNQRQQNPDLSKARASVVFRRCTFTATRFQECFFDGVAFEKCSFEKVEARACDFAGVISDQIWWPEQSSDPFTMFMMKLLDVIRERCGQDSAAHVAIQNYLIDYKTGRTRSRDFSACLYTGKVPDAELDCIETELPKLMARFPF